MKAFLVGGGLSLPVAAASWLLLGMGHGFYLPLGVFSAPLGLLGTMTALLGTPVLWGSLLALASGRSRAQRLSFTAVVGLHYVTIPVLARSETFGDWHNLARVWHADEWNRVALVGCILWYMLFHLLLWARFAQSTARVS